MISSATAVEVDDPHRGWTVTITGAVREESALRVQTLAQDPDLSRWLDGAPATYIRIQPAFVHGLQCEE